MPAESQRLEMPRPPAQTWESAVIVPLVQNGVGGLACAILIVVLSLAAARAMHRQIDRELLLWVAISVAVVVTTAFTIIRFFGDDIGLLDAAYRAGQRYADNRLEAMQKENDYLRGQIDSIKANQPATVTGSTRQTEQIERSIVNAQRLLEIAYSKGIDAIANNKIAQGPQRIIGDQDWRRARRLLVASACIEDESGRLLHSGIREAKRHLAAYTQPHLQRAQQSDRYQIPWK